MKFTTSIFLLSGLTSVTSFAPSIRPHTTTTTRTHNVRTSSTLHATDKKEEKDFMDVMLNKVDIPAEVAEEIFKAEANTPAAKDRNQRVALYVLITFIGIAASSMNVFLTNIRADSVSSSDLSSINELGFGWVSSNPVTSFFLLNGIGGGIALLLAGAGGTMVELEVSKWKDA